MSDTTSEQNFIDPRHPHEPDIPPVIAPDGHCMVCRLLVQIDRLLSTEAELKMRLTECEEDKEMLERKANERTT